MSKAASDTLEKVAIEFEAEALAELQQGREDAMTRVDTARKETSEAVAKVLETSVKQAESVQRQITGAAELEARNAQLRSLESAVTGVFEDAMKQVSRATGSGHEKALKKLIEEGVGVIGSKATVHCSAKDSKAVSQAIKAMGAAGAKLTLGDEPLQTAGGVMLTTADGSIRFDNTFEARLERMRPSLRKEVATILTGSG